LDTNELLEHILGNADEFKGQDILALEVTHLCSFTDYFVLVTGSSRLNIQAMAEEMIVRSKHADRPPLHVEGLTQGEWVLLDFGDVVVHLFTASQRAYFDLENLWSEAERVTDRARSEPLDSV